jgi:hypothetical protein
MCGNAHGGRIYEEVEQKLSEARLRGLAVRKSTYQGNV